MGLYFVVGVDGGTTKTVALVADESGRIIGAARTGGSNWSGEDVEIPMAVVIEAVQQALSMADLNGSDVQVGVFTLAGADWPEDPRGERDRGPHWRGSEHRKASAFAVPRRGQRDEAWLAGLTKLCAAS